MRRGLFTLCSTVCLLLCVAVCVLWVRSRSHLDVFAFGWYGVPRPVSGEPPWVDNRWVTFASEDGRLSFRWRLRVERREPTTTWRFGHRSQPRLSALPSIGSTWRVASRRDPQQGYGISVCLPAWLIAVLTFVAPATALIRWWRVRRRQRPGLCPACGYDLRATPIRCPECGAAGTMAA